MVRAMHTSRTFTGGRAPLKQLGTMSAHESTRPTTNSLKRLHCYMPDVLRLCEICQCQLRSEMDYPAPYRPTTCSARSVVATYTLSGLSFSTAPAPTHYPHRPPEYLCPRRPRQPAIVTLKTTKPEFSILEWHLAEEEERGCNTASIATPEEISPLLPPSSLSTIISGFGLCAPRIVVDARHQMLGRMASIIVEELNGLALSSSSVKRSASPVGLSVGSERRTLPWPIHFRAPAKILWRTIRGMILRKTKDAAAALVRLKTYEGVPPTYDKTKRMVIPDALEVPRLELGHKYYLLGRLSTEAG